MYQEIIFMHDYDDPEPFELLEEKGEEAAIEYLSQWDSGEGPEIKQKLWGKADQVFYSEDDYILSYNLGLGYISLCKKISD